MMKYLKFRMNSKQAAINIKKVIVDTANTLDFVTLEDVKVFCDPSANIDEEYDSYFGWRASDLTGHNIKIVMAKMGEPEKHAYLYICEPTITITKKLEGEKIPQEENPENNSDMEFIDYLVSKLEGLTQGIKHTPLDQICPRVIVRHKKGKKTVERDALLMYWTGDYILDNGNYIKQDLGMCLFADGHFERISYKNIQVLP